MKKTIGVLLILMLLITGCGNKEEIKTKEEPSTEVSTEVDTETKEQEKTNENVYILEGMLMSNIPPHGTGIKLNSPIEIKRQWNNKTYTFDSVYFSGDEIYNYVDRDEFIYEEPFILLSEDSDIPVKIKFDFSGFIEAEGVIEDGHIWTDEYEILEVNGSSKLVDKSNEPYPFENQQESDDKKGKDKNDISFYDPASIKVGQNIGEFKVAKIEYVEGQKLMLELKGNVVTKGTITGYYNDMYGENEFIFTPKSKITDKPIKYTFNSGFTSSIANIEGRFNVNGLLDQQTQNYILEGNELSVEATIIGFGVAEKDETSGERNVEISKCDIFPDEKYIGYIEGENGKKPSLQNETFTTSNQGDLHVDYKNYRCVIIPMHDTINNSKADTVSVDFGGENTEKFRFTVFGEIQDVKINYVPHKGEEGSWKDLGIVANSIVEISASLPNDTSSIIVHGRYHEGEGYYKDIKFSLDDIRNLTEYDIILFE